MRLIQIVLLLANLLVAASFLMGGNEVAHTGDRPQQPIHPEVIRIVDIARESRVAPAAKVTEQAAELPVACANWGSFPESQAVVVETRLAPLEFGARLSRTTTAATTNYLVIIPPITARADLNARSEELKRLGVADQFVINEGELRYGISLGYFRSEEAANRHLASLKAKGIEGAIVKPKPSGNVSVTLHIKDVTAAERNALEEIAGGLSGAQLRFQPCPVPGATG